MINIYHLTVSEDINWSTYHICLWRKNTLLHCWEKTHRENYAIPGWDHGDRVVVFQVRSLRGASTLNTITPGGLCSRALR